MTAESLEALGEELRRLTDRREELERGERSLGERVDALHGERVPLIDRGGSGDNVDTDLAQNRKALTAAQDEEDDTGATKPHSSSLPSVG